MISLKSERERLGKELRDIAEATRIRIAYLKAIEDFDFKHLPVEVYSRSYIRDYARYLGVDPNGILEAYERFIIQTKGADLEVQLSKNSNELEQEEYVKGEDSKNINTYSFKSLSNVSRPLIKLAAVLFVMVIVGSLFYWIQSGRFTIAENPEYRPPLPQKTVAPLAEQESQKEDTTGRSDDSKVVMTPKATKHNLSITATERVWIQVIIDGKDKRELTLNPGDSLAYEAEDFFNLIIGNAGGIKLRFDDSPIDNLGASGNVVKIRLPQPSSNTT